MRTACRRAKRGIRSVASSEPFFGIEHIRCRAHLGSRWELISETSFLRILFSLLFVTFFDTTGTLIPIAKECGYVKEDGSTEGINKAFISDAIGGIIVSVAV